MIARGAGSNSARIVRTVGCRSPPVYLVHGEKKARLALTDKLEERYRVEARRPRLDEVVSLV